ncbi:MAG: hypothetical protein ACXAAO_07815 [Candidatus Thorarchaeota archaeon]
MMHEIVTNFGLSSDVVNVVDVDSETEAECPVLGLPAVRICDEFITGLPDIDVTRGAVMNAVLKRCFSDGWS